MSQWLQWTLIVAGLVAISVLVTVIRRHWHTLQTHKRHQARARQFQQERRASMVESIRVLALAIEEDQVEYSEACLRIKGLLDHLAPELLEESPFRVFREVHERIQHMPTHRARQATDNRFIRKMDKERREVESEHTDAIRRAATAIRLHRF